MAYSFGANALFADVQWRLEAGQHWSLVGGSGQGKSTLLALMAGALVPTRGQLFWRDQPYEVQHQALLGRHAEIGYLTQQDNLQAMLSVEDNLRQAQRHQPEKKARTYRTEALQRLGLASMAKVPLRKLSGGQRQRVALATLLAGRWPLLLLDEPFGQLDYAWRAVALRFLEDHAGNAGVVLVSHDPAEALPFAQQMAFLDAGRLYFPGSPQAVYHHPTSAALARLTGEVNELDTAWQRHLGTSEKLLRPGHLRIQPRGAEVTLREKRMGAGGERWWIGQEGSSLSLQMAAPAGGNINVGQTLWVDIKKPPRGGRF